MLLKLLGLPVFLDTQYYFLKIQWFTISSSFQEVAEICYLRLNLVLIAIEARKYEGGRIWINPINKKVTPNTIGLFITESSDAAKRAWFFCRYGFIPFPILVLR